MAPLRRPGPHDEKASVPSLGLGHGDQRRRLHGREFRRPISARSRPASRGTRDRVRIAGRRSVEARRVPTRLARTAPGRDPDPRRGIQDRRARVGEVSGHRLGRRGLCGVLHRLPSRAGVPVPGGRRRRPRGRRMGPGPRGRVRRRLQGARRDRRIRGRASRRDARGAREGLPRHGLEDRRSRVLVGSDGSARARARRRGCRDRRPDDQGRHRRTVPWMPRGLVRASVPRTHRRSRSSTLPMRRCSW